MAIGVMTITKVFDKLYKIEANAGMAFVKSDLKEVYGALMYTPTGNPDIVEVKQEVADTIRAEIEKNIPTPTV